LRHGGVEDDHMLPIRKWEPQTAIGSSPRGRDCSQLRASMIDFLRRSQHFPNLSDWLSQILSGDE
jgi:hypothetical protein